MRKYGMLQFLGLISYSLYLTHNPILGAGFFLTSRILPDSVFGEIISFLINVALVIGFAFAFWFYSNAGVGISADQRFFVQAYHQIGTDSPL